MFKWEQFFLLQKNAQFLQPIKKLSWQPATGYRLHSGAPVVAFRNEMTDHYIELEQKGTNREKLEEITIGSLSKAVYEGDTVYGSMMNGQIAGLVKDIKPWEGYFRINCSRRRSV